MKQLFTPRPWLPIFLASAVVVYYIRPDSWVTVVAVVVLLLALAGEFMIWFYTEMRRIKDQELLIQSQKNELSHFRQTNKYLRNCCKELKDKVKMQQCYIRRKEHQISDIERNGITQREKLNKYVFIDSVRREDVQRTQEDIRILRQENGAYVLEIEGLKEELTEQKEENASMRQELQNVKSYLKLQQERFDRYHVARDKVSLEQWNDDSIILLNQLKPILMAQEREYAAMEIDREIQMDDLMIFQEQLKEVMFTLDDTLLLHHMYYSNVCDRTQQCVNFDISSVQVSGAVVTGIPCCCNRDIVVGLL